MSAGSLALALSWGVFPVGLLQLFTIPALSVVYFLALPAHRHEVQRAPTGWLAAPWVALLAAAVLDRLQGGNVFTPGHLLFLGLAIVVFVALGGLSGKELATVSAVTGILAAASLALNVLLVIAGGRELSTRLPLTTGCIEGFDLCVASDHILTGPNYLAMALAPLMLTRSTGRIGRALGLAIPLITLTRLASANALVALLPGVAVGPALLLALAGLALTTGTEGLIELLWTNRVGAIAYYLAGPGFSGDVDFWNQPLDSTIGRFALVVARQLGEASAWPVLGLSVLLFTLPARTLGWRWLVYAATMLFLEDSARNFSVVLLAVVLCAPRES